MTKQEIQEKLRTLSVENSSPCLSITFPVNPENAQYEYHLKRHIEDAKQKLRATLGPEHSEQGAQAKSILEHLEEMTPDLTNFAAGCRGYGIFISPGIQTSICLPFEVESQTIVGDSFQVRELAYALNLMEEYLVLHISEHKMLTLRGFTDQLNVVQIPDMVNHIDEMGNYSGDARYTGMSSAHRGTGPAHQGGFVHQGGSQEVDNPEHLRNFMVKVDQALGKYLLDNPLRIVLMGTEKKIAHFQKSSKNTDKVIGMITGNYDHLPALEIGRMAAQVVQDKLKEERNQALEQLQNAIGQKLYVAGLQSVWQAAYEGRVRTLFVERHYQPKAVIKDFGYLIDPDAESDTEPTAEDAVDDLIEMVIGKGGNVMIVEDGQLESHQQLAAIMRF